MAVRPAREVTARRESATGSEALRQARHRRSLKASENPAPFGLSVCFRQSPREIASSLVLMLEDADGLAFAVPACAGTSHQSYQIAAVNRNVRHPVEQEPVVTVLGAEKEPQIKRRQIPDVRRIGGERVFNDDWLLVPMRAAYCAQWTSCEEK